MNRRKLFGSLASLGALLGLPMATLAKPSAPPKRIYLGGDPHDFPPFPPPKAACLTGEWSNQKGSAETWFRNQLTAESFEHNLQRELDRCHALLQENSLINRLMIEGLIQGALVNQEGDCGHPYLSFSVRGGSFDPKSDELQILVIDFYDHYYPGSECKLFASFEWQRLEKRLHSVHLDPFEV
jgi:hypothetical protein